MKYSFDPFYIEYEKPIYPLLSFKEECVLAVNTAVQQNVRSLPFIILMSGGIDSELVAESFLMAKVPFKCLVGRLVVTLNHKTVILNDQEYQYAERWCRKNNIEIIYQDIDIYKKAELLSEYALSCNGFSPQYACHMYLIKWCKDNGYFFVSGHGEIDIILHGNNYYLVEEQREFVFDLFRLKHDIPGTYRFWKQNSRMIAAFSQLPTAQRLMNNREPKILDYKHMCYADIFEFEPRSKQTGFERIQEWDAMLRVPLKNINEKYDNKYLIPINLFWER